MQKPMAITNDLKVRGFALNYQEMNKIQELKQQETVEETEEQEAPGK